MTSVLDRSARADWSLTRGPLWRRSAFCSAMSSWRDFALRGRFSRQAEGMGLKSGNEFQGAVSASRELKGEGW